MIDSLFEKIQKVLQEQDNGSSTKRWLEEPTKVDLSAIDVPIFHPPFSSSSKENIPQEQEEPKTEVSEYEDKRYLGKGADDSYYYLAKSSDGSFLVLDAEGKTVYGDQPEQKEQNLVKFLQMVQKDLELTELSADLLTSIIDTWEQQEAEPSTEEQAPATEEPMDSEIEKSAASEEPEIEEPKSEEPKSEVSFGEDEELEKELEKAFQQQADKEESAETGEEEEEEEEEEEPVVVESVQEEQEQEELIPGGKAEGMSDEEFDQEQLEKGTKIEMEHTDDPMIAKEIAKDHLAEFDYYYDALEEMEEQLRQEQEEEEEEEEVEQEEVSENSSKIKFYVFRFLKKAPADTIWEIYDSFVGSGFAGSDEIATSPQAIRDDFHTERARQELSQKVLKDSQLAEHIYQSYLGGLTESIEVGFGGYQFRVDEVKELQEGGLEIVVNGKPFQFTKTFVDLFKDEQGKLSEDSIRELAEAALSKLGNVDLAKLVYKSKKVENIKEASRRKKKVELEVYVLHPVKLYLSESAFTDILDTTEGEPYSLDTWYFDTLMDVDDDDEDEDGRDWEPADYYAIEKLKQLTKKYKLICLVGLE